MATGRGVKVAVIDSGVVPVEGLDVTALVAVPGVSPTLLSGHGTIVAGLIAGPHGVAPDAQVFDVKVFDAEGADPTAGRAAADLRRDRRRHRRGDRRPAREAVRRRQHLARRAPGRPALEAAIARLVGLPWSSWPRRATRGGRHRRRRPSRGPRATTPTSIPPTTRASLAVSATPPGRRRPQHLRRTQHGHRRRGPDLRARSRSTPPGRGASSARSPPRGLRPRSAGSWPCCVSASRARRRSRSSRDCWPPPRVPVRRRTRTAAGRTPGPGPVSSRRTTR